MTREKQEGILVCLFFAVLVFAVVILTGTLTSGFHLVDDWEYAKYEVWMKLEGRSLWDCMKEAVGYDLTMRLRPLYYVNRVLCVAVFGINLTALSVIKALEIVIALTAFYGCAREMQCRPVYAVLFALTVMVGYQSAVWWKLGPQESFDSMLFALGFLWMLRWLYRGRRRDQILSIGCFLAMSLYKETFVLLFPFLCLYVVYDQMRGQKLSLHTLWNVVKTRLSYLLVLSGIFVTEMLLILFVIGTNNYSYVGLDQSLGLADYIPVWQTALRTDLKWYVFFGSMMLLILLTYGKKLVGCGWEFLLALSIMLPQCITYGKTAITERYLLPWVVGYAFFFIAAICRGNLLSGGRRMLYTLCLLWMLAVHGRIMLQEADYFTYRGESISEAMENTLALVKDTDKKVLSCFYPNLEANRTMYYWFLLQGYDEFFYWEEDRKIMIREFGEREDETTQLDDIDVILMYNEEDRHFCYTPSLDLSDFTEQKCGTITMYVRKE